MHLVPSKKDKRLMDLRMQARSRGLNVELTHLPKLDPTAEERVSAGGARRDPRLDCVAYQQPVKHQWPTLKVLLQRVPPAPTVVIDDWLPGWHLDADSVLPESLDLGEPHRQALVDFLATAPASWFAVAIDARFVSCYWAEKDSQIEPTDNALKALKKISEQWLNA